MTAFATVDQVKEYLDFKTSGTEEDGLLERLCDAATAAMQSYMTRTIASAAVQDKFSGHGSSMHVTSQYPIVSVQSVSVDGVAYSASNGKTTGFVYDEFAVYLIGASFGRGVLNSVIDYTAGYATVPADIVQACARWAAHFYRERSRIGENSKNIQGMVVSFDVKDIPPQVKSVLDAYRKRVPV